VWTPLDGLNPDEAVEACGRLEEWGYSALWMPEAVGRDPFALIGFLAARTSKLIFATGIANIYARDAITMRASRESLHETSGGRFILGLGVSHSPIVEAVRGHDYGKPVATMRRYLEALEAAPYAVPSAKESPPVVLAALRPKMLALAGERTAGAHPFAVPPEHTAAAREILGDGPLLAPAQKVLLEKDASKAREIARRACAIYASLANYQNNLRLFGFDEKDWENGPSDRLVDALVAWGDEKAIAERVDQHYQAGADHVCIEPLNPSGEFRPDLRVLEALAPGKNTT
jgi:probable F420-dependent oxidoreductase